MGQCVTVNVLTPHDTDPQPVGPYSLPGLPLNSWQDMMFACMGVNVCNVQVLSWFVIELMDTNNRAALCISSMYRHVSPQSDQRRLTVMSLLFSGSHWRTTRDPNSDRPCHHAPLHRHHQAGQYQEGAGRRASLPQATVAEG